VVVAYDPFSPEAMTDPYPLYRELREQAPVHRLEQYDAWALSRFAEVWEVLEDRERFSIVEGPVFHRDRLLVPNAGPPAPPANGLGSFAMLDPPEHTRYRQAMHRSFTPRRAAAVTPDIEADVAARLGALDGRAVFDVVEEYAGPVATTATLRFLGLPLADAAWVRDRVTVSNRREPGRPGMPAAGLAARQETHDYLVAHIRTEPGAVACALLGMGIDEATAAVQLGSVLVGGVETLPKIIAGALVRMAADPSQYAVLRADASTVPGAFEEAVRLEGVLQSIGRTLLTDAVIGGQPMCAGQRLFLLLQSANRDDREFPDAERFDVRRVIPRHVGFGQGTHFCIGVQVARTAGVALLGGFVARYPSYSVDLDNAERPPSEFQIGWAHLPVAVGA
jgi:cytochrome P450